MEWNGMNAHEYGWLVGGWMDGWDGIEWIGKMEWDKLVACNNEQGFLLRIT